MAVHPLSQVLPPGGGLTLTNPAAQPSFTAYAITGVHLNVSEGTGFLNFNVLDANGNVLSSGVATLTPAQVNAAASNLKTLAYQHLAVLLSLVGTVS